MAVALSFTYKQSWDYKYNLLKKSLQLLLTKKYAKSCFSIKKLITTSKRRKEHPFAGQNTQQEAKGEVVGYYLKKIHQHIYTLMWDITQLHGPGWPRNISFSPDGMDPKTVTKCCVMFDLL